MLFRQMEYLQAVVKYKSFHEAAEICHVSQSAISQQIKKLEDELGVKLLERHNRTFSVTEAGTHFYEKSLVISSDIQQLIKEIKEINNKRSVNIRLGCYVGYKGTELENAVAKFLAEYYPSIKTEITFGSHEELYETLECEGDNKIDIALNDQRRAFSSAYCNCVLAESRMYIAVSAGDPLSELEQVDIKDLKNKTCVLVAGAHGKEDEKAYYDKVVGLHGEYLFAESVNEARFKIIAGKGYMPVDVIGEERRDDDYAIRRILLTSNGSPVTKNYCLFWKKENSNYAIEELAEMIKAEFDGQL